jgi:1,4-dihydroxy-2-naphthoate octaprenyltransferase
LTVFLFFGLVAVCGTYYVQAGRVSELAVWSSLPMGFLITAILVVNNLRDIETDRAAGKKTLAVRLGVTGTRWEYALLLAGAYLVAVLISLLKIGPAWVMVSWFSTLLGLSLTRTIWSQSGRPLNNALAGTGQLTLVYGILFSLGLILTRWI